MSAPASPVAGPSTFRSVVNVVVLWAIILAICLVAFVPQFAWLMFLVWLPLYLLLSWRQRLLAACLFPVCGAILVAHFNGYRVIGPEFVIQNDPSPGGDVVVSVGPGNLITLADGRSFQLAGLRTIPGLTLSRFDLVERNHQQPPPEDSTAENRTYPWGNLFSRLEHGIPATSACRDHHLFRLPTGLPARVRPIDANYARVEVTFRYQPNRGCLMDFNEEFFPPRINQYRVLDLATTLLGCEVLEPDDSEHGRRYRELMPNNRSPWRR